MRLSRLEISPRAAGALVQRFGGPEAVFEASEAELATVEQLTDKGRDKVLGPTPAAIERDLRLVEELGVSILPLTSDNYPPGLKEIYDPPVLLYVRGSIIESDKMAVAIVGSRRASVYGRTLAERIARDLSLRGLTIISGGARGVDTAAHKGALAAGGRTVAFLGCGIDVNYPAENKKLFQSVAESGAVVSEFSFGSPPEAWRFPPRNRLISGMSLGVLVCQSPEASGALITAGYAAEQGKDVYALPGNVDDDRNRGCHKLIKDGARLVEGAEDILSELGLSASADAPSGQISLPVESLNDQERAIATMLSLDPMPIDEIIERSGLSAPAVSGTLTILEMKLIVRRVPGNAYVRVV
ncbi:MAG: DNA protecting protein DprA [Armatimonadetes bacterium RBG_16_58_9]|nr:MAG: DNA protecting protein DprA [Armatimonadetes bacterium RBG_16_58_9]